MPTPCMEPCRRACDAIERNVEAAVECVQEELKRLASHGRLFAFELMAGRKEGPSGASTARGPDPSVTEVTVFGTGLTVHCKQVANAVCGPVVGRSVRAQACAD